MKDKWFHSFVFDDGDKIDGIVPMSIQKHNLNVIHSLGVDFKSKNVLDIGCFDGYYCYTASKLNANSVIGIDVGPWNSQLWKTHFDYVMQKGNISNAFSLRMDFFDWDENNKKDLVIFMGVLYHLKHPVLALEKLRKITKGKLVLESHIDCNELDYPAMRYYPNRELNNDPTNWWGPNIQCIKDMMTTAGFNNIVYKETSLNRCIFVGE